jgi:hypothetical protein
MQGYAHKKNALFLSRRNIHGRIIDCKTKALREEIWNPEP